MERRSFLKAILLAGAAPAIIKAEILMPVKKIAEPKLILPDYLKVDGYTDEEVIGVEHLEHVRKMLDAAPFPNDLMLWTDTMVGGSFTVDDAVRVDDRLYWVRNTTTTTWAYVGLTDGGPQISVAKEQIERAEKPPGKQPKSVQNYLDMRGKYGR